VQLSKDFRTSCKDRIAQLQQIRRMWIEQTGDPDAPIARVVQRSKLR